MDSPFACLSGGKSGHSGSLHGFVVLLEQSGTDGRQKLAIDRLQYPVSGIQIMAFAIDPDVVPSRARFSIHEGNGCLAGPPLHGVNLDGLLAVNHGFNPSRTTLSHGLIYFGSNPAARSSSMVLCHFFPRRIELTSAWAIPISLAMTR